ncbi:enoyl-CoA hydratase/isomerase family protein [Aquabacterium sp.]|uniref:enoyl-CoA hydratase/isomerase family protein n=1 Tax=Aquabacterium sp. TaxID=1872578 RepID=UPI002CE7351E|nr:enoyl-CoA hydratase/isomerase family protein [Aquabacterium sp.]HSW06778.1 enoyl-CoA hydratase/isomerase family protein [Aquabacterium sp.]
MPFKHLLIDHRGPVSWLYLNRPQALNAISFDCMKELRSAWLDLRERSETRVIVVSGKGRGFCAGADLTDAPALNAEPGPEPGFLQVAAGMEEALLGCAKPVIAAVNGTCCGGGLELALMCDFIIAAESAKIGDAHANFGALPGGGATVRLPRLVGLAMAKLLMYSGELFPAAQMVACGLVTRAVPAEQLEDQVQALADKIAGKSPIGLARMKTLLNDGWSQPAELAVKTEKLVAGEHMRSWDAAEGGRAFGEKRKPEFRGY